MPGGILANLVSPALDIKPSPAGIIAPVIFSAYMYNRRRNETSES